MKKIINSIKKNFYKSKLTITGRVHLFFLKRKISHSLDSLHKIDLVLDRTTHHKKA